MDEQAIIPRVGRMFNPPHPGAVLKELYVKPHKMKVVDFAMQLDVDRKTVSRLLNGRQSVSAEMALRLAKFLGTTPDMWLGMQSDYDLWHAEKDCQHKLERITPHQLNTAH